MADWFLIFGKSLLVAGALTLWIGPCVVVMNVYGGDDVPWGVLIRTFLWFLFGLPGIVAFIGAAS